ncbi:MAG: AAA family ATPase [Thiotrichales bacterium]
MSIFAKGMDKVGSHARQESEVVYLESVRGGTAHPNAARMRPAPVPAEQRAEPLPINVVDFNLGLGRSTKANGNVLTDAALANQFRRIKRAILGLALDAESGLTARNVIAITSPYAGEGKTYVASNLALSLAAEKELNVLLIDGDLECRGLSKAFGIAGRFGLADALAGDVDAIRNALYVDRALPSLFVIPAGSQRTDAEELVATSRMKQIVAQFASGKRPTAIIIDCPPLLQHTSASVLAQLSGQIAIVCSADNTTMDSLAALEDKLPADRSIGFILNRSKVAEVDYYKSR